MTNRAMAPAPPRRDSPRTGLAPGADPMPALRDAAGLLRRGRAADAVTAYRRILKAHGDLPEAHHNLGVALRAAGRADEAIAAYRRAIELRPNYAAANHHLAVALDDAGQAMDALRHYFVAYRQARDRVDYAQALAEALRVVRMRNASPAVLEALLGLYDERDLDHQDLMAVSVGLVLARDGAEEGVGLAETAGDAAPERLLAWGRGAAARAIGGDPLLLRLLRQTIVADERAERLIQALRRVLLDAALAGEAVERPLAAAIACQAWNNGYALPESAAESDLLARLGDRDARVESVLALAMYRPLGVLTDTSPEIAALRGQDRLLDGLMAEQIDEVAQDRAVAERVERLTPIDDSVSIAVQRQYEEHPYPRWRAIARRPARPLAEVVGELFPWVRPASIARPPHSMLVAGCGTGRHALAVAFRYAEADILAVDLSRASLGYALRRARALGVDNIRFRQADLLHLDTLAERFDLIESSGVLHHLADPEAGWRVLAGLLKPGGFLKLGLYSAYGRQDIAAARAFVASKGYAATDEGIREARQAIRALPADNPARRVAEELDFASTNACRDLLFHVQEQHFTIPRIADAVKANGLQFLGFEIADRATRAAYAQMFPNDRRRDDLARWRAFEEQRPQSFRTMYQFWCRKP